MFYIHKNILNIINYLIILFIIILYFIPLSSFGGNISVIIPLSFGMMLPATGTNTITIKPNDNSISGNAVMIKDNYSRGAYGLKCNMIGGGTFDIQNISTGNPNVTLTNLTAYFNGAYVGPIPASIFIPNTGFTTIFIGGTLTFASSAVNQTYSITATLVLNCPLNS